MIQLTIDQFALYRLLVKSWKGLFKNEIESHFEIEGLWAIAQHGFQNAKVMCDESPCRERGVGAVSRIEATD